MVISFNLAPPPAVSTPEGVVADAAQERIGQLQLCCIHYSLLPRPFSTVNKIVPSKCLCVQRESRAAPAACVVCDSERNPEETVLTGGEAWKNENHLPGGRPFRDSVFGGRRI